MYDLITIGDIKLDTFIQIPSASVLCKYKEETCELCVSYGKKIPVEEIESQIAGSAPNVAIGLARMGKRAGVISTMGDDATYRDTIDFLKNEAVGTKYIESVRGERSSFSAVLNYEGESTQLVAHTKLNIKMPECFPKARYVHLSEIGNNFRELFFDLIRAIDDNDIKLSFNPGAVQIESGDRIVHDLIAKTYLLIVNRLEANQLLGIENGDMDQLLSGLTELGAEIVIITDGKKGAYASHDGARLYAKMFPGERVEATGAGDAFATGCLGALVHGKDVGEALAWGSVNAASVVNYIGPTAGLLSHSEIEERLKNEESYKVENY